MEVEEKALQRREDCEDFSYVRCVDNMLGDDSKADRLLCHIIKQVSRQAQLRKNVHLTEDASGVRVHPTPHVFLLSCIRVGCISAWTSDGRPMGGSQGKQEWSNLMLLEERLALEQTLCRGQSRPVAGRCSRAFPQMTAPTGAPRVRVRVGG